MHKTLLIIIILFYTISFSTSFTTTIFDTSNSAIPSNSVFQVAIDSADTMWISTGKGIAKFYDSTWVVYNDSNSILYTSGYIISIAIDKRDNSKWFGTGKGLFSLKDTIWTSYADSGITKREINTIAIDLDGNKWIGTEYDGVQKLGKSGVEYYKTDNSEISSNLIRTIAVDSNNNKWFGTSTGFLHKYNDTVWTTYETNDSFYPINQITVDHEGGVWFNQSGRGLHRILSDTIFVCPKTGYNGLLYWQGLSLLVENENVWYGDAYVLGKFNGSSWEIFGSSAFGQNVYQLRSIITDRNGSKWVSTRPDGGNALGGLYKLEEDPVGIKIINKNKYSKIKASYNNHQIILNKNDQHISEIFIYNLKGRLVKNDKVFTNKIDLKDFNLPNGLLLINITSGADKFSLPIVYQK